MSRVPVGKLLDLLLVVELARFATDNSGLFLACYFYLYWLSKVRY